MRLGAARRDWLQQLRLVCSIMLMRLQELCKSCASLVGFMACYRLQELILHLLWVVKGFFLLYLPKPE